MDFAPPKGNFYASMRGRFLESYPHMKILLNKDKKDPEYIYLDEAGPRYKDTDIDPPLLRLEKAQILIDEVKAFLEHQNPETLFRASTGSDDADVFDVNKANELEKGIYRMRDDWRITLQSTIWARGNGVYKPDEVEEKEAMVIRSRWWLSDREFVLMTGIMIAPVQKWLQELEIGGKISMTSEGDYVVGNRDRVGHFEPLDR